MIYFYENTELHHYGVKGMKWGVRKKKKSTEHIQNVARRKKLSAVGCVDDIDDILSDDRKTRLLINEIKDNILSRKITHTDIDRWEWVPKTDSMKSTVKQANRVMDTYIKFYTSGKREEARNILRSQGSPRRILAKQVAKELGYVNMNSGEALSDLEWCIDNMYDT